MSIDITHSQLAGLLPPVLLASGSPRRRQLLSGILGDFEVALSDATEICDDSLPPRQLCEINARRKALSVASLHKEKLVLGADTLVFLDGRPLGKPVDLEAARGMLSMLSGRTHEVVTGVCLAQLQARKIQSFAVASHVRFRLLKDEDIDTYLTRVDVLDKAGAYAIQEHGSLIVERFEGSLTNIIGLPVDEVRDALMRWLDGPHDSDPIEADGT